jgi:hypothetical protein
VRNEREMCESESEKEMCKRCVRNMYESEK